MRTACVTATSDSVILKARSEPEARAALIESRVSIGSPVGPYVIEKEIGSGGMGTVWLARRSDGLIKRPVALKLPHAGVFKRQLAERFESERNILSDLEHPNIARLYDAGLCADGQPYVALEYGAESPAISLPAWQKSARCRRRCACSTTFCRTRRSPFNSRRDV